VRSSVVVGVSLLVHVALVAFAAGLPTPAVIQPPTSIEVDVRSSAPKPEPPKPEITPPLKTEPPKLALKTPERRLPSEKPVIPEQPLPVTAPPQAPQAPPQAPSERPRPLDLRLHALPSLPATAPGGEGISVPASGGTFGTAPPTTPRKEWHPRGDAGDAITGKLKPVAEDRFPLNKVGRDEYVYKGPQFSAHINPDGTVSFDDKIIRDFKGTSGSFDITDLIMKSKNEDPYRHEKKRFMEATDKLRGEIAARDRAEKLRSSLASLPANLDSVWGDRRRSAKSRRSELCAIWSDVSTSDDDMGNAGAAARRIVEAYIRRNLPEGSDEAYPEEEMATCSRRAKSRFSPY